LTTTKIVKKGIGTGWSTFTPNYSPRDIVANLKRLIKGEQLEKMAPWYKGFKVVSQLFDLDLEPICWVNLGTNQIGEVF